MFNFLNILGTVIHTLIVNWAFDLRCSLVRGGPHSRVKINLEVPVTTLNYQVLFFIIIINKIAAISSFLCFAPSRLCIFNKAVTR